ncbi:MAG: RNA 2',3'-cyclic phosphodiesterase [Phycisphaerales bacterium]
MRRSDTLRLFVALYPPPEIATTLLHALAPLTLPDHHVTPVDHVHLTLVFIGDRRVKELREVRESVERSASGLGPFDLTPQRLITIPTPAQGGRPRLIASTTDTPPMLLELQRRLATRLARPDERHKAYTPHITLCRYAHEATSEPIHQPISIAGFRIDRVQLMSSIVTRDGAKHEVQAEVLLTG